MQFCKCLWAGCPILTSVFLCSAALLVCDIAFLEGYRFKLPTEVSVLPIVVKWVSIRRTRVANIIEIVDHLTSPSKVHHLSKAQYADLVEQLEYVRPWLVYGKDDNLPTPGYISQIGDEVPGCVAI